MNGRVRTHTHAHKPKKTDKQEEQQPKLRKNNDSIETWGKVNIFFPLKDGIVKSLRYYREAK